MLKRILFGTVLILLFVANTTNAAQTEKINRLKVELGGSVITQIEFNPALVDMFNRIYGGKITPENIMDAMSEYKRSRAGASRFDDYQGGNNNALNAEEKHGFELFKSYGCAACHNGPNVGGSQFKQLGIARNFMIERKTVLTPADLGLAEVTRNSKDFYVFKVPSLRNVAITYPYYHDGSVKSLDEAVSLMGKYQLGVAIPQDDIKAIVVFLKSLTAKSLEPKNSGLHN